MRPPLSTLGILHTAISLIPLVAGLVAFAHHRRILPATASGRVYLAGLALSVLTAFGLSSTGGFNPGHALGLLTLLVAGGSLAIPRLSLLGRARPYLATLGLSFTFFLLLVPGINETLTRLPTGHPLANGPESPLVKAALLGWLTLFAFGALVQMLVLRASLSRSQAST